MKRYKVFTVVISFVLVFSLLKINLHNDDYVSKNTNKSTKIDNNKIDYSDIITPTHTEEEIKAAKIEKNKSNKTLGYNPNNLIIKYNTSTKNIKKIAKKLNGKFISDLYTLSNGDKIALVDIPQDITTKTAINEYEEIQCIKAANRNLIFTTYDDTTYPVNDPSINLQYHLCDDDNYDHRGINCFQTWKYLADNDIPLTKNKIAVIDSGACIDHEDLTNVVNKDLSVEIVADRDDEGNITDLTTFPLTTNDGMGFEDLYSYLNDPRNFAMAFDHGTHVSGIIAAESNNSLGGAGVASMYDNSIVDLIVIDGLNYGGSGETSFIIKGMEYVKEQHCKALNMSLGAPIDEDDPDTQIFREACDDLYDNNISIIVAAGNTGNGITQKTLNIPACYDSTVGVINTTKYGDVSYSSCYYKDYISAPGTNILSTVTDGYGQKTGTSMASPVVCGAVAVLYAIKPNLTPMEVKNYIFNTATDIYTEGHDDVSGYGLMNLYKASKNILDDENLQDINAVAKDIEIEYDGSSHRASNITVTTPGSGYTIQYSTDRGYTWSSTVPSYKDLGVYIPTFKISATGFKTLFSEYKVSVLNPISCTVKGVDEVYDGSEKSGTVTVTKPVSGALVEYSTDGGVTYSSNNPIFIDVTLEPEIVHYRITADGYYTKIGTFTVNIKKATIDFSSQDYEIEYDGNQHSGEVIVNVPEGALVEYSTDAINYSSECPSFVDAGTHTVLFKITANNYSDVEGSFFIIIHAIDEKISVFRLYNPNSGEHLYTIKETERDKLSRVGWKYEGIAFNTSPATKTDVKPVYRVYNPNTPQGSHLYTKSLGEANKLVKLGWKWDFYGKACFYSYGEMPIYRLYNKYDINGNHLLTKSKGEYDKCVRAGWIGEGIQLYAIN